MVEDFISVLLVIMAVSTMFLFDAQKRNEISSKKYQEIIESPFNLCKEKHIKNREYISNYIFDDFKDCERNLIKKEQEARFVYIREQATK